MTPKITKNVINICKGDFMKQEKRYQVFISSNYEDLKEERASVIESILKLLHIPVGMEQFVAANDTQFNYIKRVIDESDYYVLIIGNRYGSIASDGVSYTEKEFDYAVKKNIPILTFVHSKPETIALGKSDKTEEARKLLSDFKEKATRGRLVSKFKWDSPDALAKEVVLALTNAFNDNPRPGWERISSPTREALLVENNKLHNENDALKKELHTLSGISITKSYNLIGSMTDKLSKAKKDVIIFGGSMVQILSFGDALKHISTNNNVTVRLLALNVEDPAVADSYKKMKVADEIIPDNLSHLTPFKDNPNIEIRVINSINAAYFYAVDINEPDGYIGADHFLTDMPDYNYPHVDLKRNNEEWYNIYQQQIETLWNRAIPWNGAT